MRKYLWVYFICLIILATGISSSYIGEQIEKDRKAKVAEARKLICSKYPEHSTCQKSYPNPIEKYPETSNYIGGYEFTYDATGSISEAREILIKTCGVGEIISSLPATDIESMLFSLVTHDYENTLIKRYCKLAVNQIDNFNP